MLALVLSGCAEAAGFQMVDAAGGTIGVWYPTEAPNVGGRLGPFDVEHALDAAPTPGLWPPILLSHGNGGRFRNHHLTAGALASAGFIVIAPQHSADHRIGGSATAGAVALRIEELRRALTVVSQDPVLGPTLDLRVVHAIGYSLGGATVIAAGGAVVDLDAAQAHCALHGDEDAAFCDPPPFLWRLWQWARNPVSVPDAPNRFFVEPFINGSIAVVAPIGQGLIIDSERILSPRLLVIAIEGDNIAQPRFHAEAIAAALPRERLSGYVSVPAHHFAFIAPFSDRVTAKRKIPIAQDPEGFDRPAFIEDINARLVEFFCEEASTSPCPRTS